MIFNVPGITVGLANSLVQYSALISYNPAAKFRLTVLVTIPFTASSRVTLYLLSSIVKLKWVKFTASSNPVISVGSEIKSIVFPLSSTMDAVKFTFSPSSQVALFTVIVTGV